MSVRSVSILGCGWLGLPLAESLVKAGYRVKGSTTHVDKTAALKERGIQPYVIDLSSDHDLDASDFLDTDALIVLIPPRSKTQIAGAYLSQMKHVTDAVLRHPSIRQLIYTSSTSVYPDRPGFMKEENVEESSQSAHPELLEVENLFQALSGLTVTVARLGGLTGGSRLLARHFAGKKELSGGYYPVNLLHQEDGVNSIIFLLQKRIAGVFNVCSPVHPYKKDFYIKLAKRFGLPLPEFKPGDRTEGKMIDVSKLGKAGYVFSYPEPDSFTYDEE